MRNPKIRTELDLAANRISLFLDLLNKTAVTREKASCPYSGLQVGCALHAKDGNIITACNVENASCGLSICGERVAIFKAVSEGCGKGDLAALAVAASGKDFSPCGECRQVIHEFGSDIIVIFELAGEVVVTPVRDLLPHSFKLNS